MAFWGGKKTPQRAQKPAAIKWNNNKNAFTLCPEQDTRVNCNGTMAEHRPGQLPYCVQGGRHDWQDDEYVR